MTRAIDLNADLGEGCGDDEGLMAVVTSANIACGGHAGDEASMRAALRLAKAHGVAAGAHPSYPDRENFGRQSLEIEPHLLKMVLIEQIRRLKHLAEEEGVSLTHIKPHGALYNDAAVDPALATVVAEAARRGVSGAALVGPPRGEATGALAEAAAREGLAYRAEGFADRAYRPDGRLVSRSEPGAVIGDEDARLAQALALARGEPVTSPSGETVSLAVDTICLHGDSPGALESARAIRVALEEAGLRIEAPRP